MEKRITVVAATVLPLLYFFSSCNSKESHNQNSIPTDSVTIAQGKDLLLRNAIVATILATMVLVLNWQNYISAIGWMDKKFHQESETSN